MHSMHFFCTHLSILFISLPILSMLLPLSPSYPAHLSPFYPPHSFPSYSHQAMAWVLPWLPDWLPISISAWVKTHIPLDSTWIGTQVITDNGNPHRTIVILLRTQITYIVLNLNLSTSANLSNSICPSISSIRATALTLTSLTRPMGLQDPRQSNAHVEGTERWLHVWDKTRGPQLKNHSTSTVVMCKAWPKALKPRLPSPRSLTWAKP